MEGPGIRREILKNVQMRKTHCRTYIMARNLKNVENETQTLYDLEYDKQHSKTWILRNAHCRNWNMVTLLKIMEKRENHTWNIVTKTEKRGKREILPLVPGIWQENWQAWKMTNTHCGTGVRRENWKSWKMRKTHCMGWNMARNTENVKNEKYTL